MITVDEMKKLLSDVYGINSPKELDKALDKLGGIDVAIFTQAPKEKAYSLAG